jgi:DAK2 domain fusion protein YloV
MSELDETRELACAGLAALEQSRRRIDDLNVYPVPDGDTGTNLTLTGRAIVEGLESSEAADRAQAMRDLTRAALMGARGNSGVIFSQIARGAAEVLGDAVEVDAATVARAVRAASDAAYRAVRRPVEGTMLTVIRELAEEAESRAPDDPPLGELLVALVRRGEQAVARTPELLDVLREAGVVDAGGAGLLEIVRGIAAAATGEPIPEAPPHEELGVEAIHQELSRFRYCTVFLVEGEGLDRDAVEARLDPLGDSLLVVGDPTALKIHVHTDDPGAALSIGASVGVLEKVEIANMHAQTVAREERLLEAVPDPAAANASDVVAVVAGEGNRRLFESLGAATIVSGGQTMNPSTADLVAAIESTAAPEAIVLPNNSNVILSAEQAADLASKPVEVVGADSIPAGLAAMVVFDGARSAVENAAEMRDTLRTIATGEVTVASRDVELDGLAIGKGNYFGLAEGEPVAQGADFGFVAQAVVERLLAEPRDVLTLLTGADEPDLAPLLEAISNLHPEVEVDVQSGGQPHYPLLISAE